MATIPLPARGADIALARLTLQTVNASTGVLTDAASVATITTRLAGFSIRDRVQTEDMSAITSTAENQVGINQGTEYVLRERVDRTTGALDTAFPKLAVLRTVLISGSGIAKIEITRGHGVFVGYGQYTGYSEDHSDKSQIIGEMTFAAVDAGVANVAYTP